MQLMQLDSINNSLNWKLKQIDEKNLPAESITDYVAYKLKQFDEAMEQNRNLVEFLKEENERLKETKQRVSEGIAEWFLNAGVSKIDGIKISSITISDAKKALAKVKKVFKTDLNKAEIEEFLLLHKKGEMVEVIENIPAKKPTIRINARRKQ